MPFGTCGRWLVGVTRDTLVGNTLGLEEETKTDEGSNSPSVFGAVCLDFSCWAQRWYAVECQSKSTSMAGKESRSRR